MSWDERDPHGPKDQHTEVDELRLIERIRELTSKKRQEKTEEGQ